MTTHKGHKRGPWSQSEDHQLMSLVQHNGALNWVRIAQFLGSRTPKQCRERYHQNLKPSLNHEPISAEEGEMIERMVREVGKRWAEIARRLHNRSDNAVKNWWNGSQNRRKRTDRRKVGVIGPHHGHHMQHDDLESRHAHDPQHHGPYQQHLQGPYRPYYHHGPPHDAMRAHGHGHGHDSHHQGHYETRSVFPLGNPNSLSTVPRSLSLALPPLPLGPLQSSRHLPSPLSPVSTRGMYETPLPSPSALSPGAESVDMAPSLASDNGSSHYSTSPRDSHRELWHHGPEPRSDFKLAPLIFPRGSRDGRSNSDSVSPTDRQLPSCDELEAGFRPHDHRRCGPTPPHGDDSSHSPQSHHVLSAPGSPANNFPLPALREPPTPQEASHEERGAGKPERMGIAALLT